jgi:hypothetical protein
MSQENKEFYDLLNELVDEQTFDLELTDGSVVKCKSLTTAQLKDLIKAVVDSPITQSRFNSAATKIFKDSVELPSGYTPTVVDRLLFLFETRINSISPTIALTNSDDKRVDVDLIKIGAELSNTIKENQNLFHVKTFEEGKFFLTVATPTLFAEEQLNEEVYATFEADMTDNDSIRNVIADMFIYEIAKYISSLTLDGRTTLDFTKTSFQERVNVLQKLPVALTQKIVEYIEKQKSLLDQHLIVDGLYLSIDSAFFTIQ